MIPASLHSFRAFGVRAAIVVVGTMAQEVLPGEFLVLFDGDFRVCNCETAGDDLLVGGLITVPPRLH